MVRREGKDAIYEAAEAFRERCLAADTSLLWPDHTTWTPQNLDEIYVATIGAPDSSGRDFFEKWEDQLNEASDAVYRIASDAIALYLLYPSEGSHNYSTKLEHLERVYRWRFTEEPDDFALLLAAYEARGLGNPGPRYKTTKPYQVAFYHEFAAELKREGADPYSPDDCKEIAAAVEEKLPETTYAARYILLHLLFPDHFEQIVSRRHRKEIISTFGDEAGEYSDEYEALSNIRERLPEEAEGDAVYFYRPEVRQQWDSGMVEDSEVETAEQEEDGEGASPNYWIEKTLVEGRPDREEGEYALGEALWSPKTDERGADIYRFMRDVEPGDVVLHLTDNEAFTGISRVAEEWEDFDGVEGTAWGEGPSYLVHLEDFEPLDPPLSRSVFFEGSHGRRLKRLREEGDSVLFYTSDLELRQGAYLTPAPEELIQILNDAYRDVAGRPLVEEVPSSPNGPRPPSPGDFIDSMDDLARVTLWPRSRLQELIDAIEGSSPQVVLAGPPGTSKTWVAKHVARYLTEDLSRVRMVQFHPSYGYEDFIEGLRPVSQDGAITFRERPGVLLQIVEAMEEDDVEEETHVLVIDEMNRANLPRVFGELMYLFEYRGEGEEIQLQYTSDFSLPRGLKFIGTMNTADRSIRSIDIALRRRFDVFECKPEFEILRKFYAKPEHTNEVDDLFDGFEKLNEQLRTHLDRHHTVGHTFFMAPTMNRKRLSNVWKRKIGPLIEEYFFDQPDVAEEYTLDGFWPAS